MSQTDAPAIEFEKADRLQKLPPYLFVELDKAKRALQNEGKDVIDLGVGDPDIPTPDAIQQKLKQAVEDPANHRYSFTEGIQQLREAIAAWYQRRFDVQLDPEREILPLLGSKEGIALLPLALANPGDAVLIPDPGYPPYRSGTLFAGADAVSMPLLEENGFFPDFGGINQKAAQRAKIMFLNYPNNPTSATASIEQFKEAIDLAKNYQIAIAHDAAYTEIAYDGTRPISFLQTPDAKSVGVEFHSLSKSYQMTGWRIGWVCGNESIIAALGKLKNNLDSGIFQPIQWAGIEALNNGDLFIQDAVKIYQNRRDLLIEELAKGGWVASKPSASLYIWTRVPTKESSIDFSQRILRDAHVVLTPGVGFGVSGEGYVRMSLTVPTERMKEAAQRICKVL